MPVERAAADRAQDYLEVVPGQTDRGALGAQPGKGHGDHDDVHYDGEEQAHP